MRQTLNDQQGHTCEEANWWKKTQQQKGHEKNNQNKTEMSPCLSVYSHTIINSVYITNENKQNNGTVAVMCKMWTTNMRKYVVR